MACVTAPLDHLLNASEACLHGFRLSRLGKAANLEKHLCEVLDTWLETKIETFLASCILRRNKLLDTMPDSRRLVLSHRLEIANPVLLPRRLPPVFKTRLNPTSQFSLHPQIVLDRRPRRRSTAPTTQSADLGSRRIFFSLRLNQRNDARRRCAAFLVPVLAPRLGSTGLGPPISKGCRAMRAQRNGA
jgi:hypothetical protein